MNRRLYFLIPDRTHALSVVDELAHEGIGIENMHALGGQSKQLDGLPSSSLRQYNDAAGHLDEFRDAMAHGEILLMVDVPEQQVADIENLVHHHHPEATVGGVSWGTPAFGL